MKHYLTLCLLFFLLACSGNPQARRDKFYASGQDYLQNDRLEEAVIQFRNAIQIDSGHVPSHLAIAKTYQRQEEHQRAVDHYRRILDLDADNIEAKVSLGRYQLMAGDFQEARRAAEEVLEKDPKHLEARILLGNAFAGLNDLGRSVKELKHVLEADPENLTAHLNLGTIQLQMKDPVGAERTFKEAIALHPDVPAGYRALADFYTATQRYEEAEENYTRALEAEPRNPVNLYSLVRFHLLLQAPAKAEEVCRQAADANPDWREPRWALANLLLAQGKLDEGIQSLNELVKQDSKDRIALLRLAEVHLQMKETAKSEEIVKNLLVKNASDPEARYLRGKLYLAADDRDKALAEFDKALESNRNLIPAHREKAQLHLYRMEFSQAQTAFSEILRVDPSDLGARAGLAKVLSLLRRPEEALVAANQVLERAPESVDALTARAEALLMSGRYDDAGKDFGKLAETHPNNPFYLHRMGAVETMKGNTTGAMDFFRKALEVNPNLVEVINDMIFLYMRDRKPAEALRLVDEMAAKSTRQDVLHLFRGKIHLAQDSYAEAEKDLRRAIEANPESYEAYMLLGQMNLKQERVDEAIREVEALIAKRPDFAPAFLLKAFYLERKRDSAGAMQNYQKVLELSPDNPIAANNLAWNYCVRGENLETALGLARKARQKDPENAHIADTLGWVYYKMGSYTLAADQLLFAVNKGKPGPENYYRLGMAYYKKGDQLQAKQALRRALEMSQSFTGAAEARAALLEIG